MINILFLECSGGFSTTWVQTWYLCIPYIQCHRPTHRNTTNARNDTIFKINILLGLRCWYHDYLINILTSINVCLLTHHWVPFYTLVTKWYPVDTNFHSIGKILMYFGIPCKIALGCHALTMSLASNTRRGENICHRTHTITNSFVITLRPKQNGRHSVDDIFHSIFFNEDELISIKMSLKFVPNGPFYSIPTLLLIKGLASNGRQAIIWINYGLVFCYIYTSLGLNELRSRIAWTASHIKIL